MGTDVIGSGLAVGRRDRRVVRAALASSPSTATELPGWSSARATLVGDDLRAWRRWRSASTTAPRSRGCATTERCAAVEGDASAATLVELSEATFSEFLHELLTASGCGVAPAGPGSCRGEPGGTGSAGSPRSGRSPVGERSTARTCGTRSSTAAAPRSICTDASRSMTTATRCATSSNVAGYLHVEGGLHRRTRSRATAPRSSTSARSPRRAIRSRGGRSTPTATRSSTRINYLGRHSQPHRRALLRRAAAALRPRSPAPTCGSATTGSTARWCSSRTPTS